MADYHSCECVPIPGWENEQMYDEYYKTQPTCKRMPMPGFMLRSPCDDYPKRGNESSSIYDEWFEKNGGRPGPCNIRCNWPDYELHRYKCQCVPRVGNETDPMYD